MGWALPIKGDRQVTGLLERQPDQTGASVWIGSGLPAVGLAAGTSVDEDGVAAARLLMKGCDPRTGARLVKASVRAHPDARLPVAPLIEVIDTAAHQRGGTVADSLAHAPQQLLLLERQRRMVRRFGAGQRYLVGPLQKLARAAGVTLDDVYGPEELSRARAHAGERVSDRVSGWSVVLDLPKSDSVLAELMPPRDEQAYRSLIRQARQDTVRELEGWVGYGVGGQDGGLVRLAADGLLGWSTERISARPLVAGTHGDPHVHVFVVIANLARCQDGVWRSIAHSGRDLMRHTRAADEFFKARVRALAWERFGVCRERARNDQAWEIPGAPVELGSSLFSTRAEAVKAETGADAPAETRKRVSTRQRLPMSSAGPAELRAHWRRQAAGLLGGESVLDAGISAAAPGPDIVQRRKHSDLTPAELATTLFAPDTGLLAQAEEFSHAHLLAVLAEALPYGLDGSPGRLDALAHQILALAEHVQQLPSLGSTLMSSTARCTTHVHGMSDNTCAFGEGHQA